MELMSEVPTSEDSISGVTGDQQAGTVAEIAPTPPPLEGQFLHRAFIDAATENPRRYGGEHNAPLITALLNDFAYDKDQARKQAADTQSKLDQALIDLNEQKQRNARLEERLSEGARSNLVAKVCTFLSPVALSVAIDLFKANSTSSYLIGAIGVALLLTNFVPHKGKN